MTPCSLNWRLWANPYTSPPRATHSGFWLHGLPAHIAVIRVACSSKALTGRQAAAEALGISKAALYRKIQEYRRDGA